MAIIYFFLSVFLFSGQLLAAEFDKAKDAIRKEIKPYSFEVGISALHIESGKSFSLNGATKTPMASVYKFPIGLAALKVVEEKKLSLNEKVRINVSDIRGGYKGPIAREYPKGGVSLTISELLEYMVAYSDNSASDLLLSRIGGPEAATRILRKWGFRNISIDRYEKSLIQDDGKNQNMDTASANEMVKIMQNFFKGDLLSSRNTELLKRLMTSPKTPGHIAKGLPEGTPQFHKSGWCSKNRCINDVTLVTLPENKGHLAIAVLTSGSIKDTKGASNLIGKVSRIAFDSFLN